jgi:N-acetylglucosaminyldiphosphoundecaprenol N-acetyl-beta-D-mannosaminyltransferase
VKSGVACEVPDARYEYFGTRVTPSTFQEWLQGISVVLENGQRGWLCGHHNLHSLYMLRKNTDVGRFYERCNDCYIDGMSIRIILIGFGITSTTSQRFSLMDHFLDLLQHAQKNDWSVFYLGSHESVVKIGTQLIEEMFPKLRIRLQHGYSHDDPALVATINAWQPDILLVGMGMPLQERWLVEHLDYLDVGFAAQAGATLDYYTGAQAKPPLWMSRIGFAWLYRLLHDPLRLWWRYLGEPWALLYPTLRQWHRHGRSR